MTVDRVEPAAAPARTLLGMPRTALVEVLVFFAVALVLDAVAFDGTRYRELTPHPFWLFVLIVSAHYGTATGVFAAVVGTLLVFLGNLPSRDPLQMDQSAYLLAVIGKPLLWFVSAVVLGELRARRERVVLAQDEALRTLEAENAHLAAAKLALEKANERLQTSAAGQVETTLSLVQAARTVDVQETHSVFASVAPLIRNLLQPSAYSIYLRHQDRLDLVVHTTDGAVPRAQERYSRGSALFDAVIDGRQLVHIATPEGQEVLGKDGIIAGPLVDPETSEVLGMLKVEALPIAGLTQSSIHAFKMLSEWIATAYRNAKHYEEANRARVWHRNSQLFTDAYYQAVSTFIVALAERAHFEVSQLTVRIDTDAGSNGSRREAITAVIEEIVTGGLRTTDLAFDYQAERGEFVIILPMTIAANCRVVSDRLRERIREGLADAGMRARVAITYETLYVPTAADIKPWHRAVIRRTDPYTL